MIGTSGLKKVITAIAESRPALLLVLILVLSPLIGCISHALESRETVGIPISSGSEIDYPPFCFVDADGNPDGFSVELMRAALAAMGRDVTFRVGPWNEVRGWLENGEVQALPLVGRTPERESLFDFTFPYMSLHGAIVVRKGTAGIWDLDDLSGKQVAVMKGDNAEEFLRREDRGIEIHTTDTFEDALRELSAGRHDAVVIQRLVAIRLLQEIGLTNLEIINTPIESFRQDWCFAVKEGDRDTLALLNEGLSLVMADGTYRRLHSKWFAALELPSNRRIVIGGDHNYPPYEYLDENGRPTGFTVELTQAISKEMGLDIEIRLGPWDQMVSELESGEIDVIQGIFYSSDRDLKFDFTQPHLVNQYVSVVRHGEGDPPADPTDLTGKSIVIQRGDVIHSYLLQYGLGDRISLVETQEDVLREVAEGNYDCGIVVRISALYLIEKFGFENLVPGRKPIYSAEYCYAVANGNRAILAQFSEGLRVLDESGDYRRIYEKYMSDYDESSSSLSEILRHVALGAVPLVIIVLLVILWSWTLRKQVAARTEELRKSEEYQKALIACSPLALYSIDLDGNVQTWNASSEKVFGWSVEEVIGKPLPIVPEDKHQEFLELRQYILEKGSFAGREVVRRKKDGNLFIASLSAAPINDAGGNLFGIMGAVEEITDKKLADEMLRGSEERYRRLFESAKDGILIIDADKGKVIDANPFLLKLLGYDIDTLLGKQLWEIGFFKNIDESKESFKKLIDNGYVRYTNLPLETADGAIVEVEFISNVYLVGKDRVIQCNIRDITEQMLAQNMIQVRMRLLEFAATHTSDELMSQALNEIGRMVGSPIGFFHCVAEDQVTLSLQAWSSDTLEKFCRAEGKGLHYSIDQAGVWVDCVRERRPVVHNDYDALPHKKGMPEGHAAVIRELVVPVFRSDIIVAILGMGNKNSDYTTTDVEVVSYLADVTWEIVNQKRIEEELEGKQALLKIASELSLIGGWSADLVENRVIWSDEVAAIRGMPLGAHVSVEDGINSYAPEFRDNIRNVFTACARDGVAYDEEMQIITGEGRRKWVRTIGIAEKDALGSIVKVKGALQDITERKLAEVKLRESEEKYRHLLDSLQEGIWAIDPDGLTTFVNPSMAKMLGYTQKEMEGKHLFEFMDEQGVIIAKANLERRREGITELHDFEFVGRNGNRIYASVATSPLLDEHGKYVGAIAGIQDISGRKLAEERIMHLNRVLLAIRQVNQLIVRAREETTLISEGCRVLVDNRGYTSALIVLMDHVNVPVQWAEEGMGEAFGPLRELLEKGELHPCFKHAQETGKVLIVDDRKSMCGDCPMALEYAESQVMCVALVHENDFYGYLSVSLASQLLVDDEERSLFSEMASDLAYALHIIKMNKLTEETEKERKSLKGQLLQAQKMESVGRLAGGVAHDFNNMLTIILGNAEMAQLQLSADDPLYDSLNEILEAGRRSADLTRQLLAFARKQVIKPVVLDLNAAVEGMLKMLRRLLGEDIDILWKPSPAIWPVKMDPAQIDQIMANLCVNARDAILGQGKVTVETHNIFFDEEYCDKHKGFHPGEFVMLAVSDDGKGMDRENLENIFEPFFTTKKEGQGTGLGLSMVYGIVKQNEGFINVYSEPDLGTTFKLYMPRHEGQAVITEDRTVTEAMKGRGETVLLVEDEPNILRIGKTILEKLGYIVLTADSPDKALRLAKGFEGEIALLLTDVIMPEMNGRELANFILDIRPGMKCLFMSGYTANVIAHHGVIDEDTHFVQKPLTMLSLAEKVRETLDS